MLDAISRDPRPQALPTATLAYGEQPLQGAISIRGAIDDGEFAGRVANIIGHSLPTRPHSFVKQGEVRSIWLGPDEWLLMLPNGRQGAMLSRLDSALEGLHHAVTDVTGNRTIFEISGSSALDVLAQGSSLDFSAQAFPPGMATQTLFAQTPILILRDGAAPTFEMHVRRSFRSFLGCWLLRAATCADAP